MQERKLTKEDIDKVRDIDGFPIGEDEDIIALSNAPYYTACPNPFIEDFIKEFGTPYDEETDDYHCEPFASDVSEGKNDPIYMAHTYHTKVPYKAIMKYILHYTKPGDIVFDGFCGTGMTGVAAQMCGSKDHSIKLLYTKTDSNWGARIPMLNDLSPVATFISKMYNSSVNIKNLTEMAEQVIREVREDCDWMYKTKHISQNTNILNDEYGKINYTVWSDVFICPHCGEEIIFYNDAFDKKSNSVKEEFKCHKCSAFLTKKNCERAKVTVYDMALEKTITITKQVPVLINYIYNGVKYTKIPDKEDLYIIDKISNTKISYWFPQNLVPKGCNTEQPKQSHGIQAVHHFYTNRNLYVLSLLYSKCFGSPLQIVLQSIISSLCSKLSRYNMGNRGNGPLNGTLYIPSLVAEAEVTKLFESKLKDFIKAFSLTTSFSNYILQCGSHTKMPNIPSNCIDYIFTDPPFGDNINYSELSFIWECWLKVRTNNVSEAIINKIQDKSIVQYQNLMTESFKECYRILKPGRWITIVFHNSKNAVWNAIQEALQVAGFVIADIRTLDKKQGSFKQMTTTSAVKQDLVISAYKPKEKFKKEFLLKSGSEETTWDFVRQHLEQLPVTVIKNNKIEIVTERQAFLLWDRMVSYHIMNGLSIPMDASTFYKGLDEKFLKRDDMYFLPSQVNEYDDARIKAEVEPIQYSLIISNEKSAIGWLYNQLSKENGGPKTYAQIQPKFMQECTALDKREKMPELSVLLEENFLQDENGKWYIPDLTKTGDIAKLREKNLLKEFQDYLTTKGKLKVFRSEAIKAGFAKLWKDKDYKTIVDVAERLPEETIQEDSNLLMYYDISLSRV